MATFLLNTKSNWKCVSVNLNSHSVQLQIDTTMDITLITQKLWKTIGQSLLTPARCVVWNASGDCPQKSKLRTKQHRERSREIQDTTYWVLILLSHWIFCTYHSILFEMQFPDLYLRVPLQSRLMTPSVYPQLSQMSSDSTLKLYTDTQTISYTCFLTWITRAAMVLNTHGLCWPCQWS